MKVVLIHGHNRKGSTYHIAWMLVDELEKEGKVEGIDEVFVPQIIKNGCFGCYSCIESEEKCPYYKEKMQVMNLIEAADLLIFTTPTYCMAPSAQMKQFMDLTFTYWMPHKPRTFMFQKKAVVISTAAGTGCKKAIEPIARMLFYWGVPLVKKYGVAVQAKSWDEVTEKRKQKIAKDIVVLARKLSNKKQPSVRIKTKFMFSVMRMMQKNNMGSGLKEREYWESMGWLGKDRPWKKK